MIAFHIWPLAVHWYGIFYAVSFLLGYFYVKLVIKYNKWLKVDENFVDDLLFYTILWVLFGGRLGYVFFYNFNYFLHNPIKVFYVWEGWMAFVWAFIWVALALWLLSRKYKINYLSITDLIVSFLPFWLGLGRIWNFINWELFWKICPVFLIGTFLCYKFWLPEYHIANQLLESFFEGWLIFLIFQYLVWKKNILKNTWLLTWIFIVYYAIVRFILEFIRWHPDNYILWGGLSKSQYFMIFLFIIGLLILIFRKKNTS